MRRPTNEELDAVVRAVKKSRPDICSVHVYNWLDRLTSGYGFQKALQEDLRSECLLYFLEVVFGRLSYEFDRHQLRSFLMRAMVSKIGVLGGTDRAQRRAEEVYQNRDRFYEPQVSDQAEHNEAVGDLLSHDNAKQVLVMASFAAGVNGADIARRCGISRERVRKIRQEALG